MFVDNFFAELTLLREDTFRLNVYVFFRYKFLHQSVGHISVLFSPDHAHQRGRLGLLVGTTQGVEHRYTRAH